MNRFKHLFIAGFILTLCLFNFTAVSLAEGDVSEFDPSLASVQDKEITLSNNAILKLKIPSTWRMDTDQDGNFNFNYVYSNSPLIITLFNNVQPYKEEKELKAFISLHEKAVLETIKNTGEIKTGIDNVFNIPVPYMLVPEIKGENLIFHKLMYPYDGKNAYVIMITYEGTSPINKSEDMLSIIMFSIFKQA